MAAREVVLVVDDDPQQTRRIADCLARHDIDVVETHNGFAALSAMRRGAPRVVIIDILLPGLDGIETAKLALKAASSEKSPPKIILMSNSQEQIRRAERARLDVFAVVDKPIPLRQLVRFVKAALGISTRKRSR